MAASSPPKTAQNLAFEIPIEKKNGSSPNIQVFVEVSSSCAPLSVVVRTVCSCRILLCCFLPQKRLAAQANSPRKEVSLADLNKKLSEASERKEAIAISANARTASHNAEVRRIREESIKLKAKAHQIQAQRIDSKLSNAEANRDGIKNTWARRISAAAKAKVRKSKPHFNFDSTQFLDKHFC